MEISWRLNGDIKLSLHSLQWRFHFSNMLQIVSVEQTKLHRSTVVVCLKLLTASSGESSTVG